MAMSHTVQRMATRHKKEKQMNAERKTIPIGLRVPREMADWLKREADENRRSVSSQVTYLLDQKMKEAHLKTPA